MAFDGQTYMKTKTTLMTAAAALALWDNASDETDKLAAGEHLATILRAKGAPKAKAPAKAATPKLLADLRAAMKVMTKQVPARHTIPVLSMVSLVAEGDTLTLKGTDLDSETVIVIDAPGLGTWSIAVGAKDLAGLLKANGDVLMEADEAGRLLVMIGGATSKLVGLRAEELPSLTFAADARSAFTVQAETLASLVDFVEPGISTEEARYYLNGAYLHTAASAPAPRSPEHDAAMAELFDLETAQRRHERAFPGGRATPDLPAVVEARAARITELTTTWAPVEAERMKPDVLRMVTTDGHRMNLADMPIPAGANFSGMIVPRSTVALLKAALAQGGEAQVSTAKGSGEHAHLRLTVGNITISTKVIEGTFPDYTRVVPKHNDKVITVIRQDLIDAVKSVASINKERSRAVRLDVADRLRLSSQNVDGGKAEASVSYERPEIFEQFSIGFNAAYLLDALAVHGGETVDFAFADAASPALCLPPERSDRLCVLMPLRL